MTGFWTSLVSPATVMPMWDGNRQVHLLDNRTPTARRVSSAMEALAPTAATAAATTPRRRGVRRTPAAAQWRPWTVVTPTNHPTMLAARNCWPLLSK